MNFSLIFIVNTMWVLFMSPSYNSSHDCYIVKSRGHFEVLILIFSGIEEQIDLSLLWKFAYFGF